ncbi:hypothetical protein Emed_005665 [Eimeria media]
MGSSKLKPRCGCLALAFWFLLHLQQHHSLVAFAGDSNEKVFTASLRTDEENLADVRIQEFQQVTDEPVIVEATPRHSGNVDREDGDLGVADQDVRGATRETMLEGDRARMIQKAKSMFRVIAGVVLLVAIVRILVINGKVALQDSGSRLRKLRALAPTAETLSVAVGTPESERLWAAVESLLPEIDQTLSLAEAKLTKSGFFFFGRFGGQYADLMNRIQSNVDRLSGAIAALHAKARDQVEVMAKSIPGSKASGFGALEGQVGEVLGSEYAKAFVAFVESQEAQASQILRAVSQVIVQSYKMPMFEKERDKALLIATIHNLDEMKQLLSLREVVQRHIDEAKESCRQALASTVRADLVSAAHEYRTLFKGMSIFLVQPELQGEGYQLIRRDLETAQALLDNDFPSLWFKSSEDSSVEELLDVYAKFRGFTDKLMELSSLPEKQVIHEGEGDDRMRVQKEVFKLMKETADYAESTSQQAQDLMDQMKKRQAETRSDSFCPNVMLTFDHSMKTLRANAQENAELCRKIADQLDGDAAVESLFDTLMKGLNKDTRVSKMYRGMQSLRGYINLLQLIETDVRTSLDVLNGVDVDNMDPESNGAKIIINAKDEVAQELAALKEAVALPRAAEGAARINQASSSAAFAQYEDLVTRLKDERLKFNHTPKK